MVDIVRAETPSQFEEVGALILEYVEALPFQLTFQDYRSEVAELAETYGPPTGAAFLAMLDSAPVGTVGVKWFEPAICELKRMYVKPQARGLGAGRALLVAAIEAGRSFGYERMRLDTIPDMTTALSLYASVGFYDIPPYRPNPIPGARFLELAL